MGQPIVGGLLVVAAILAAGAGDGPRVWTDRYGNTTTAKFVRVFGGNVVLLRGGKTMTVPLGNLCDEDQELARRLQTGLPVEEDSGARNALRPRAAETGDASETEPWNRGVSPQADVSIGADEDSASPWATMPVRTWTDFQHREIEASFAGVRGKNVCLRKDGKTLLFPYGFFSAQDRLYVQTALKEAGQEDRIAALTGVEPNPRHGAMTGTEMPTSPWFAPDPSPTNIPPAADPLDEWRNEVTQEAERWQREREEAARRQREEAERRAQQWNAQPDTVFPAAPPVTQRIVHYCTKCGGELPSTVKTGDICPHCKARLVSFTGNSNQPFHAQALPAQAAPTLPIWLKIGGGLILVVLALGAAVVALKLLGG